MEAIVGSDHCYSRHWSEVYKTDCSHSKPIHWLLPFCKADEFSSQSNFQKSASNSEGSDDEIDVESLDEVMSPSMTGGMWSYDMQRARVNMSEGERCAAANLLSGKFRTGNLRSEADWEEYLDRSCWSRLQNKLFTKVQKILQDEKLARLAFKGVNNEPIVRRISLDRSAAHLRRVMAEFSWDQKLSHWLHSQMTNHLPAPILALYLDLLQTLRSKVPTLVERMIMPSTRDTDASAPETLNLLLKRPWEPTLLKSLQTVKQRFSNPPIILLVPNSPYMSSPTMAHRRRFWSSYLGHLGKVVQLSSPEALTGLTVYAYLEQLANVVQSKIQRLQIKHPGHPIVLVGWHTATLLNCQIALAEKVSAIICLGFPLYTLNGPRGTVDDVLCDLFTPTLFVVGEEADSCNIDELEDFRERLLTNCESQLLAVPGADDALKISDKVKKKACVTQALVDKLIIDYIGKFLCDVFIKSGETDWETSSPLLEEVHFAMSRQYSSEAGHMSGRRKREYTPEDGLGNLKRRRLSSSTTAKISQVLSGQSVTRNRDGTRSPVQGVTYNLQTGSISGLTTVPTVLGRSTSTSAETGQTGKHGKVSSKSKGQSRSITIDLTKDTSAQLSKLNTGGAAPAKSILPTESQTEAAVATILGNTFADKISPPRVECEENKPDTTEEKKSAPQNSNPSAFTRLPSTTITSSGDLSSFGQWESKRLLPQINQNRTTGIAGVNNAGQQPSRTTNAFTNVQFRSTVVAPKQKPLAIQPELRKPSWYTPTLSTGSGGEDRAATPRNKYEQYLAHHRQQQQQQQQQQGQAVSAKTGFPAVQTASRSRKDERETMQATAILEQLTSNLENNDDDVTPTASIIRDSADLSSFSRRHSSDSTQVHATGRGRGRIRTRGGLTQELQAKLSAQRRRRTINEERPSPSGVQQHHRVNKNPIGKDSFVRYLMTSDMSSVLSNAAAKVAAASGKSFTGKQSSIAIHPEKSVLTKPQTTSRYPSKPSLLPVYAITPTSTLTTSKTDRTIKLHGLTTSAASNKTSLSNIRTSNKVINISSTSGNLPQVGDATKSSKVFLTKKLPVNVPFTASGTSYTFVSLPTNVATKTGDSRALSGGKDPSTTPRSSPIGERTVKYSVVSHGNAEVGGDPATGRVALNQRDKAKPVEKKVVITAYKRQSGRVVPVTLSSSSVVLQKFVNDTEKATQEIGKPPKQ